MPGATEGKTMFVAELAFIGEDGYADAFWSLPYCTEKGLRAWIRKNIDERGQQPYRARIAHLLCEKVDVVYAARGRPRKLTPRPKERPALTLIARSA